MRADLKKEITQRLLRDYAFKRRGDYLQQGICPNCGHKELFTSAESPWLLKCNRENDKIMRVEAVATAVSTAQCTGHAKRQAGQVK